MSRPIRDAIARRLARSGLGRAALVGLDHMRLLRHAFAARTPLRNPAGRLSCRPFFIIGSGRSGNTLLRAMLCAHGDVAVPPESYVLGPLVREYRTMSRLPWPLLVRWIVSRFEEHEQFATWEIDLSELARDASALASPERGLDRVVDLIYGAYARKAFPSARLWGDKTPLNTLHLPWIQELFPQARYVHMIRDGRDVVLSYIENGIYSDIDAAAGRWLASVRAARRIGRALPPDRFLEVRYEDLVGAPTAELQRVCDFLGLRFRAEMLDYWRIAGELGDTHLRHHAQLHGPISTASIGRWAHGLGPQQQLRLRDRLGSTLRALGYAVDRPAALDSLPQLRVEVADG